MPRNAVTTAGPGTGAWRRPRLYANDFVAVFNSLARTSHRTVAGALRRSTADKEAEAHYARADDAFVLLAVSKGLRDAALLEVPRGWEPPLETLLVHRGPVPDGNAFVFVYNRDRMTPAQAHNLMSAYWAGRSMFNLRVERQVNRRLGFRMLESPDGTVNVYLHLPDGADGTVKVMSRRLGPYGIRVAPGLVQRLLEQRSRLNALANEAAIMQTTNQSDSVRMVAHMSTYPIQARRETPSERYQPKWTSSTNRWSMPVVSSLRCVGTNEVRSTRACCGGRRPARPQLPVPARG
jgi:hypothetical protein